jgi:dTDP-4-amino-4,6-dideoxygalactose transaminase
MNSLEKKIAKLHKRKYCVLTGNGTTAIYLALISQKFMNKKIVIPNNVCMNVVLPIYFSKNIPIFIDIEKDTLGLDISKIQNMKIDAVISVHAYGNICDIEEIERYCKKHHIFLIEDVAVAQGLKYNNRVLGSFGDVSILSFGAGKNINIEHGGAILTDNEKLYYKVLSELDKLNIYTKDLEKSLDKISSFHKKIYNFDIGKSLNSHCLDFKKLCLDYKSSFLYKFDKSFSNILNEGLDKLASLVTLRQDNARYLESKFQNIKGVQLLKSKYGSSYWRFNMFVENFRDELFKNLLKKNYKISSWYHSIDLLFEERANIDTPVSDWVGNNIINIWVNEEINRDYLDSIYYEIVDFLKGKYDI